MHNHSECLSLSGPDLNLGFSDLVKTCKVSKALRNPGKTRVHSLSQWVQPPLPGIQTLET